MVLELETAEGEGGYARQMDEAFYAKQREMMLRVVAESDVVVTTAAVPGKKAPILLTEEMVQAMPPGSVVVDLAAERGGNCELTRPGEATSVRGVTILGPLNVPSDLPRHASQMYSNNLTTFLKLLLKDGQVVLDMTDECIAGTLVTRGGQVVHPFVREQAGLGPLEQSPGAARTETAAPAESTRATNSEAPLEEEPQDTYRLSED